MCVGCSISARVIRNPKHMAATLDTPTGFSIFLTAIGMRVEIPVL